MGPARGAPEVALSGLEQGTGSLCAVRLSAAQRAELLRLARAALPGEACGLLLGSTRGGRVLVERIVGARNVAEQPLSRYRVDPLTQLEHERAADAGGPGVVGAWHSHPRTGSEPSAADRSAATEPAACRSAARGSCRKTWASTSMGSGGGRSGSVCTGAGTNRSRTCSL